MKTPEKVSYVVELYVDPWSKNECELFYVIADGEKVWERDYGSTGPTHSTMVSEYWKHVIRMQN